MVLSPPGGKPWANLEFISHLCCLFEDVFVWRLTKETMHLPLGCLQGGVNSSTIYVYDHKGGTEGDLAERTADPRAPVPEGDMRLRRPGFRVQG